MYVAADRQVDVASLTGRVTQVAPWPSWTTTESQPRNPQAQLQETKPSRCTAGVCLFMLAKPMEWLVVAVISDIQTAGRQSRTGIVTHLVPWQNWTPTSKRIVHNSTANAHEQAVEMCGSDLQRHACGCQLNVWMWPSSLASRRLD